MRLTLKSKVLGLLSICVVVILIALPIIGEETNANNVTLESLESRLLSNNLEIIRGNENAMIAGYKKEKVDAKNGTGSTQVDYEMNTKYYPIEAKMNLEFATWDAVRIQRDVILKGKELYMQYNLLIQEIGLQNAKLIRLNSDLETTKKQIALGKVKASAQTSAELTIKKENFALEQLMQQRNEIYLDLNALLHYELDSPLDIKTLDIPYEKYVDENMDDTIKSLLEDQGELKKLRQLESLASIKLSIYTNNNSDGKYDSDIISIKEDLSSKNFDVKDKELDVEYQVRSKYNTILNKYDAIQIKELEVDNAKLTYDNLVKRQSLGLEVASTINAAKETLDYAKFAVEQAKLEYYSAIEAYKNYCFNQ